MQQPISLYLDLIEGQKVNLETAARAALAFDAVMKEIAFAIDPFSQVRIELESGTEGSLSLNSIIKSVSGYLTKPKLAVIAITVSAWFAAEVGSWTVSKVLDHFADEPSITQSLSEEEIRKIAEEVVGLLNGKIGEEQAKKVYQELQRDESIRGVGVTTAKDKKPRLLVPRSEFQKRGTVTRVSESEAARSQTTVQNVTLISPVLFKSKRKWKFRQGKIEFGAPILDDAFLDRLLSGREPVPMSDGIVMLVKLTVKEEFKDGVWQVVSRTVDEVLELTPPSTQHGLILTPDKKEGDG